jgi:diguanylate cyclase (GGDEF)-like protein
MSPAAATGEPHRTLCRQLRRAGIASGDMPDLKSWQRFLRTVSTTYTEADDERYTLERSIEVSSREMRGLHAVLSRQALQDALTGLPNRAALVAHLDTVLAACRPGRQVGVLFVDLDGFKLVNDSLGHAAGDELLVRAAERIRGCLRHDDVVARLGGDEFVVVGSCAADETTLAQVAARICAQLSAPFRIGEQDAVVSASVGIATTATTATGDETAEDLLRCADLAMYAAKTQGKARTVSYDASMQESVDAKLSVRSALGLAVRRNELRLLYQPIVSLEDGAVLGAEALVRWERPGYGLLGPDEFIPVAEESPLISAVDQWVVLEACRRAAGWCAQGGTVAVNVSARTLEDDRIVNAVSGALHRSGVAPHRLTVEITETSLLSGSATVARNLQSLRELNVNLSLDDFGTGYSSLSQLRVTSVEVLKIDRSFVSVMDEDASAAAIVAAIVAMGHALGQTVVAEGVERSSQARLLREMGCDAAQGWLFGRPGAPEVLDEAFDVDRSRASYLPPRVRWPADAVRRRGVAPGRPSEMITEP